MEYTSDDMKLFLRFIAVLLTLNFCVCFDKTFQEEILVSILIVRFVLQQVEKTATMMTPQLHGSIGIVKECLLAKCSHFDFCMFDRKMRGQPLRQQRLWIPEQPRKHSSKSSKRSISSFHEQQAVSQSEQ